MRPEADGFVWENAPVVEIIAEVHWQLQPIDVLPGAAIDPFFDPLLNKLTASFASNGFSVVEQRTPIEVPREMLAHRVMRLFRKAPNEWPAFQLGPGVFTANIAPPYLGWKQFRENIEFGLQVLFASHPYPEYLRYERLLLKYVNLFTDAHGVEAPNEFIRDDLGLEIKLPSAIINTSPSGMDSIRLLGAIAMPILNPIGANGSITWREAVCDNKPAVNLDICVDLPNPQGITGKDDILEKFDAARETVWEWFTALMERKIKNRLGRKIPI